ncbi:MAG: hypothetical protein QM831_01675 [Kofleriaceae bacterium]
MAHLPAHLPRNEGDLADWSVYADQLLAEGNPLGELIALDLSLPANPTDEQRWDFAKRARERCWYQQERIGASWMLGHIRELIVRSPPYRDEAGGGMLDELVVDSLADVIESPEARLLESFQLAIKQVSRRASAVDRPARSIWRVLKNLPPTCTRFAGNGSDALLAKYTAGLPTHVTEVQSTLRPTSAELVPVRMQLARR